jgi:DNA-binding NarL/FixJ family response regulator
VSTVTTERPDLSTEGLVLLRLLADGLPSEAIARRMHISERIVRRRTRDLCDRLHGSSAIQAVAWAARRGMI